MGNRPNRCHLKHLASQNNRSIKDAGGEQTVKAEGGSLFPDVLLFGDRATDARGGLNPGHGGFPDDWIEGWMPLPAPPSHSKGPLTMDDPGYRFTLRSWHVWNGR